MEPRERDRFLDIDIFIVNRLVISFLKGGGGSDLSEILTISGKNLFTILNLQKINPLGGVGDGWGYYLKLRMSFCSLTQ